MSHNIHQEEHAKNIAAGILKTEFLEAAWRKYHYSERDNAPMQRAADELQDEDLNLSENPEAIKFMYELIEVHIGALSRASRDDTESQDLKEKLHDLSEYLVNITYPTTLLDDVTLSDDHQRIIETLEKETAQGPGPIKAFWKSVKGMAVHTYEDSKEFAKEHPKTAIVATAIPVSAVGFSYINYTPPQKTSIDPNLTSFDNYAEDIMNIVDDPNAFSYNPDAAVEDIALGCHDHLQQLMFGWEDGATFITDTLNLDEKYYEHCAYIAGKVYDYNADAQMIKDNWHLRLDLTTLEPMKHVVTSTLPESTWRDTLLTSMVNTHDFFKAGNDFENALHPLIAAAVAISVYKYGTKGLDELKEVFNHSVDFGRKSVAVPLNYLLMAGGSTYAYAANNSFTEAIVGAAVGTLAGELIHRTHKRMKSPSMAKDSLITTSKELTAFSSADTIVSDKSASGKVNENSYSKNKWTSSKAAALIGGTTALTVLDMAATGGKVSASVAGAITMGVPDIVYNLFEDPTLHAIFGVAGAALGTVAAGVKWGGRGIKHLANRNKDTDNEPS